MRERIEPPWAIFGPLSVDRRDAWEETEAGSGGARGYGSGLGLREMSEYSIGNATAGLFAGDHLVADVRLLPGTAARLTSPSATYVFSMTEGEASQRLRVELAGGAELDCAPRPLIPYRDSSFTQTAEFVLPGSAALRVLDTVVLGRLDHGEVAAMRRLQAVLSVEVDGELLLYDSLRIDARRTPPEVLLRAWHGRCTLGTLCVAGRLAARWRLEREERRAAVERARESGILLGVSQPDERLIVARALGPYPAAVETALRALERSAFGDGGN